jgi:flagellar hook-associated protein 1 FlgK
VSFSTFNTAVTGLAAAQRSLDSAGQNIVNANTPGYSRQRVLLESMGPAAAASIHSGQRGMFGGVRVADVSRIRDAFLEATRAAAGGRQFAIDAQTDILTGTERLLSEPGELGVQASLDSFYGAWHDLANSPTDSAAGAVVIQRGQALAQQLKGISDGIAAQWTTSYNNLVDVVSQINQATSDLTKVNAAIQANDWADKPTGEMRDTRDLLVRKLAELGGASATTDTNGVVSVSINGVNILSGTTSTPVTLEGGHEIYTALDDPPFLAVGGYPVSVGAGSSAGLLATMRVDLPALSTKVDGVATSLVTIVNTVYGEGFTPDGSTGEAFFAGTGANNLTVVPTDGAALAIANAPDTIDGTIARRLGDLADDANAAVVFGSAGPSAQWRQLTTDLGVQVQSLKTAKSVQDAVVASAEDAVQADAGVNLDEEMSNMMLFQRAYQASARVITVADEILDTLINRTGRVGL